MTDGRGTTAAPVAVVPVALEDGTRAQCRAVLRYRDPLLELEGADPATTGAVARRIRRGLELAGWVHPVRRISLRLEPCTETAGGWPMVHRGRHVPGTELLESIGWAEGATLAAAVAVAVAAGQLDPRRVPVPVPAGTLEDPGELAAIGCRYVAPRRGVTLEDVAGALSVWDRGTLEMVAAERAAVNGRRTRLEALAAMRRAGCSVPDMARLTGLAPSRVTELLALPSAREDEGEPE